MAIQSFKNDIHKDTHVYGYNTYLGNGQGCGTVWYKNVPTARKALLKNGITKGSDWKLCSKCSCHYSIFDSNHKKYNGYICNFSKEQYARSFE